MQRRNNIISALRLPRLRASLCPLPCLVSQSGDPYETACSGCQTTCEGCSFDGLVPACSEVMEHAVSPGGLVTLEMLTIEPGYWRATESSRDILACYNEDACLGGLTGEAGYCLEGYEGPCEYFRMGVHAASRKLGILLDVAAFQRLTRADCARFCLRNETRCCGGALISCVRRLCASTSTTRITRSLCYALTPILSVLSRLRCLQRWVHTRPGICLRQVLRQCWRHRPRGFSCRAGRIRRHCCSLARHVGAGQRR